MGRCYPHLSLEERRKIDKWREAKMPVSEIADRLGRTPSTIYRYIYSKEGMVQELWWYLPEHRKPRWSRRARKRRASRFDRDVSSPFRPDDGSKRRQFEHWEADLMLFKQELGQSNITSLVKRVSRFTVLLKNPNKRPSAVLAFITEEQGKGAWPDHVDTFRTRV
ncbi:MAG: helix-turn-helix domain-containing protein [Pseudomonadota bacterium]